MGLEKKNKMMSYKNRMLSLLFPSYVVLLPGVGLRYSRSRYTQISTSTPKALQFVVHKHEAMNP